MYVCTYVGMYVCRYVRMYVCVCTHIRMYVCTYVRMYVCVCMYTRTHVHVRMYAYARSAAQPFGDVVLHMAMPSTTGWYTPYLGILYRCIVYPYWWYTYIPIGGVHIS